MDRVTYKTAADKVAPVSSYQRRGLHSELSGQLAPKP